MQNLTPILIEDSREQNGYSSLFRVPCIREGLSVGDYSVCGLEDRIAIERKSLADLVSSLTFQRTRFGKELSKAKSYDRFYVACECSPEDILNHCYKSEAHPAAIWESIHALAVRHSAPFLFLTNREIAAQAVQSVLCKYSQEFIKSVDALQRASAKALNRMELDNRAETVHAGRIAAA